MTVRRRRREEAKQSVPLPTFRPNLSINSTWGAVNGAFNAPLWLRMSRRSEGAGLNLRVLNLKGFTVSGGFYGHSGLAESALGSLEVVCHHGTPWMMRVGALECLMSGWPVHVLAYSPVPGFLEGGLTEGSISRKHSPTHGLALGREGSLYRDEG